MIDRDEFFDGYLDAILFTESVGALPTPRMTELFAEIESARQLGRDPQKQFCELASIEEEVRDDTSLLSHGCSRDDFTDEARAELREDCEDFVDAELADLELYCELRGDWQGASDSFGRSSYSASECAGTDFWFSRNGHGAGFFARGNDPVFNRLQAAAKVYSSVSVYFDGEHIHAS